MPIPDRMAKFFMGPGGGNDYLARYFKEFKDALVTAGGIVRRSGDGNTMFSSSGDVITSVAALRDNCWWVIGYPDSDHEVLKQITLGITVTSNSMTSTIVVSAAAGFTGGSATVRPTATDEGVVQTGNSIWRGGTLTSNALNTTGYIIAGLIEDQFPYTFIVGWGRDVTAASENRPSGGWGVDAWEKSAGPFSLDDAPDRHVYFIATGTTPWQHPATGGNAFRGYTYLDGAPPATSGNFIEMRPDAHSRANINSVVPWDGGGIASFPLAWAKNLSPYNPVGDSRFLRFKHFNETFLWRNFIELDGSEWDSWGWNDVIIPWDSTDPLPLFGPGITRHYKYGSTALGGGLGSVGGGGATYRMRGIDGTLGYPVYWNASSVDAAGAGYGGPGPLTDVVVAEVLGA